MKLKDVIETIRDENQAIAIYTRKPGEESSVLRFSACKYYMKTYTDIWNALQRLMDCDVFETGTEIRAGVPHIFIDCYTGA